MNRTLLTDTLRTMFRTWGFVKPWRFRFAFGVVVGSTMPFLFPLVFSWMVKQALEAAISRDGSIFLGTLGVVGAVILGASLLYPLSFYLIYGTFARATALARKRLFEHINSLPVAYVEQHYSGDIASRLTTDLGDASQLFGYPGVGQYNPFSQVLTIVVLSAVLLTSNLPLGLFSIAVSLLGMFVTSRFSRPVKDAEQRVKETIGSATQSMVDIITGSAIARVFGLNGRFRQSYCAKTKEIYRQSMKGAKWRSVLYAVIDLQMFLFYILIIGVGLGMAEKGLATIPVVVFIANLQMSIGYALSQVARDFADLQRYVVAAHRVFEVLDAPAEEDRPDRETADFAADYAAELRAVGFQYANTASPVFNGLSLKVRRGERLAIVGGSGGGKSTLFKLLLDFVQPQSGEIELFGHRKDCYSLAKLRAQMAYVPQDSYLFDGTILENIAWGNLEATREQIEEAVKDAYLYDFIQSLPDGFDTRVGERGVQLSGGQRQRLAIARALLKDAPLLLLDEATSSLDSESEQEVQRALERLMIGRTSIVIAHRLSTIQNADRILVIEQGRIEEEGTHASLLLRGGRYATLYNMQFAE